MATNISVRGVDISYCQVGLNHQKMKNEGVNFALIRAGFTGTSSHKQVQDNLLETHVNGCIKAGIEYGFYWYSAALTVAEAKKEAAACVNMIKKFPKPSYPVFYDLEEQMIADTGKKNATDIALAFVSEVERMGYPSGVYVNPSWLEHYLDKSRIVGKMDIWLAHWVRACDCPYGQTIWQTGAKYSAGMMIDDDVCNIDYPKKTADWYKNHATVGTSNPVAKPASEKKTIEQLAYEVMEGKWGNGVDRKNRLTAAGYDYKAVQTKVNELVYKPQTCKKSITEIAKEVIRGNWGNGQERYKKLTEAGYNYEEVQREVNKLLK